MREQLAKKKQGNGNGQNAKTKETKNYKTNKRKDKQPT